MTSRGVFWVVQNGDLRTLLKAGCAPAGLSGVRLLIEGDELILKDRHAFPEEGSVLPDHAIAGDNCRREERITDERALATILHDHRDGERRSESCIERTLRFRIEVARYDQHDKAHNKEDDWLQPQLRLRSQPFNAQVHVDNFS